jgi:hypothetical protein
MIERIHEDGQRNFESGAGVIAPAFTECVAAVVSFQSLVFTPTLVLKNMANLKQM